MSKNYIGLYYPYIHFRDDNWVKIAALYWDKMARIVPYEERPRDSETVRKLIDETDFIRSHVPTEEMDLLGGTFLSLLKTNETLMKERFSVDNADIELAPMYVGKMSYDLRRALLEYGLAEEWYRDVLRLHPKLASVYMTALAQEMARRRQFFPVADNNLAYIAVAGGTVEQLAHVLLDAPGENRVQVKRSNSDIERRLAIVAFQTILPADLDNVPVEKIIKVRKVYGAELYQFQQRLHAIVSEQDYLKEVEDEKGLREHLETTFDKTLGVELEKLKKDLKSFGIDTVLGAASTQVSIPAILTSGVLAGLTQIPFLTHAAALALTGTSVLHAKRRGKEKLLTDSPAAYLLRLEQNLAPQNLLQQVNHSTARLVAQ